VKSPERGDSAGVPASDGGGRHADKQNGGGAPNDDGGDQALIEPVGLPDMRKALSGLRRWSWRIVA
jgi:hypothetical protein